MSQVVRNRFEVGDLVRVIAPDSPLHGLEGRIIQTDFGAGADPYKFESACGEHRGWLSAYQLRKLLPSSVEGEPHRDGVFLLFGWNAEKGCFEEAIVEPPADHIADANKMVPPAIPEGWRELFDGETRSKTDLYCERGRWKSFVDFDPAGSDFPRYDKTLHCQHIRKIPSVVIPQSELLGSKVEYREPTRADVGKTIEVRSEYCTVWEERELVAMYNETIENRFVCRNSRNERRLKLWACARIKIDHSNTSETPNSSTPDPLNCIGHICDLAESTGVTCPVDSCDLDTGVREAPAEPQPSNIPETPDSFIAKRPVVYLAGPMRGIPHFNFPAFDAAKSYLIGLGYDVLSPADLDRELDGFDPYKAEYETAEGCADFPETMHFDAVVLRDLTAVTQCDAIALLPGWEKSKGAVAEIAVAHWMGKPVMRLLCDAYHTNEVVYIVNNASTTLEQFVLQLAHAHDAHNKAINCAIDSTPPKQDPDCDILDVAASITRGDRQAGYGPPDQDFRKTADMWTGMFQYMLAPGAAFEPRHVAMAMICIKLSREFHQKKRDNWIDIAGYARCGSLCSS